ncbi:hypothetical protein CEP53_000178 [Fusarium sp. AF-6]|nr:hypothetical protein CEP53_000178 [Fusarium sp. AF-6]
MTMLSLAHLSLFCLLLHVAAADDGDDFANDLFTDLSPLLALFGERVTTQFMSQSIGLADCIILAMAPLGIVNIIVSAIRVGGPALMKAIIGRARENLSAAEIELMSSTSKEVCELWNGKTIVRCPGSGNILEFVCLLPGESCSPECEIQVKPLQGATELVNLTSSSYKPNVSALKPLWQSLTPPFRSKPSEVVAASDVDARKWYKMWPPWSWILRKTASTDEEHGPAPEEDRPHEQESNRDQTSDADIHLGDTEEQPSDTEDEPSNTETEKALVQEITIIRDREADAPCISLNRHAQLERREVHVTAVFGTILQLAVVIYFGLITYKWPSNFQKDGDVVDSYAFPLAASGTALLVMGILLCAHVVESSTDEKYWAPTLRRKAFIIWLQQNNSVSDQLFESYAIYTGREHERIVSSRRAITDGETEKLSQQTSSEVTDKSIKARLTLEANTVVGTGTSLAGFVLQFIGLRGLHWSASIAQLLSIIIMTVLRAAIRRGLSKSLKTQKLMPEFELDWLAMRLSDIQTAPFFGQLKSNVTDSCSGTGDAMSSESMT